LKLKKITLDADRDASKTDIQELNNRFNEITKWLEHNENSSGLIDIDAVTEPKDILSKQLLSLVAEDATIEDTLYYLEKALGRGKIDPDIFLKSVRNLATDQFYHRATIKKIHEKQRSLRA